MSLRVNSNDYPAALPDVIPGVQATRRVLWMSVLLLVLVMAAGLNNADLLLPAAQGRTIEN